MGAARGRFPFVNSATPLTPSRRRDGDATRERLLLAALDLYTTVGFLTTTTPALAARAEVAEGTIYRHFSSKEHLLNEAYRRAQRWAAAQLESLASDRLRRTPERLQLFARALVETAGREPALIRMLFATGYDAFLDEQSHAEHRAFIEGLVQLVAAGKSDGQVRAGPAELWAGVWLAVVRHAAEHVCSGAWAADGSQVAMALEAAWDAIAAR
jgi:AcrR family transcriptional regulator